jgi:nucleoside-diphosphate-sugar epimerase/phosphohistidine swiveling domain-containing protein
MGNRVLVTGASGVFGRDIATRLARAGAEVVALARREVAIPGVEYVPGDIRDATVVESAMRGCDAVAHLAWAVSPLKSATDTHAVNVGGTEHVLDAMAATGCRRIVFASSVTAYGAWPDNPARLKETDPLRPDPKILYAWDKARCEELILARDVEAVITRSCLVAGRHIDNYAFRIFAGPILTAPKGEMPLWQFVHQEDVGRFHAEAVLSERTGIVNVASDDGVPLAEIAAAFGKRLVHVDMDLMEKVVQLGWRFDLMEVDPDSLAGFQYMAVADTSRLREEWGFECAWSGRDTIRDLARSLTRVVYLGRKEVRKPWRLRYARTDIPPAYAPLDRAPLAAAAPPALAGEFDSVIDPRYPDFFATNLSEAFPGPMTPLSLTVNLDAMHTSSDGMCDFLGLDGEIRRELQARGAAAFGHRMYAGVSVVRKMAEAMPGMTPEDVDHQFLGLPRVDRDKRRPTVRDAVRGLRLLTHVGPQVAGFGREVDRAEVEARELARPADELGTLADPELLARIGLVHDELGQAWNVACIGNMIAGGALAAAERLGVADASTAAGSDQPLASAGALLGVDELARLAREAPEIAALLDAGVGPTTLEDVRAVAPWWAARFEMLLDDYGHRGPGETELENPVYADQPDMVLGAIAKALHAPAHEPPPRRALKGTQRAAAEAVARAMRVRERARDAVVRLTHALRLAVRERGSRLAAAGVLTEPGDVFYLSYPELLDPPPGIGGRIQARRAERERLRALRMPTMFSGTWEPEDDEAEAAPPGTRFTGIAAAPGTARGPARIVRQAGDLLEPGEILVANITDTGWTPLFAFAAGVVTDIGGLLSHPTVVARDYGIPCVVGVGDATRRLRDGQLIEVDGTTGAVRVVE